MEVQNRSDLVKQMNQAFADALKLIEEGAAKNSTEIRDKFKSFFQIAEQIEKEIAMAEVSSINRVNARELEAIEEQKEKVTDFTEKLNDQIIMIENQLRECLGDAAPLLEC